MDTVREGTEVGEVTKNSAIINASTVDVSNGGTTSESITTADMMANNTPPRSCFDKVDLNRYNNKTSINNLDLGSNEPFQEQKRRVNVRNLQPIPASRVTKAGRQSSFTAAATAVINNGVWGPRVGHGKVAPEEHRDTGKDSKVVTTASMERAPPLEEED